MSEDILETKVPFPKGTSIRDLLNRQELASVDMDAIQSMLVSSRRLSDVMPYLHKPASKPPLPEYIPPGSIFRGMVFGHISIYTNRSTDREEALVMSSKASGGAPPPRKKPSGEPKPIHKIAGGVSPSPPPAAPPPPEPAAPAETPPKRPVQMVGMPQGKGAKPPAGEKGGKGLERPIAEGMNFFSESRQGKAGKRPSEEKMQKWTEIIPKGTRVKRPVYPGMEGQLPLSGERKAPSTEDTAEHLPPAKAPAELRSEDRLRMAREADRLLTNIISLIEGNSRLEYDVRSDLVAETRMLQMELDKFRPKIVRITEMLLDLSDMDEIQPLVASLKENLRGLGLLL